MNKTYEVEVIRDPNNRPIVAKYREDGEEINPPIPRDIDGARLVESLIKIVEQEELIGKITATATPITERRNAN